MRNQETIRSLERIGYLEDFKVVGLGLLERCITYPDLSVLALGDGLWIREYTRKSCRRKGRLNQRGAKKGVVAKVILISKANPQVQEPCDGEGDFREWKTSPIKTI